MDQTVLITGAGSNCGLGLARHFFAQGARVVLNDVDRKLVEAARAELAAVDASRVLARAGDISSPRAVQALVAAAERRFGAIDVLVNNAAVLGVGYAFVDTPMAEFDRVLRVNIRGTYLVAQQVARLMIRQERGSIINISSNTAERALRNRSAYIMSKGAISALTRALALELAPYVRVNTVAPGFIWTRRWNQIGAAARRTRRKVIPLHEPAQFEDIAELVGFLASAKARNITGACYTIDGGVSSQLLPPPLDV